MTDRNTAPDASNATGGSVDVAVVVTGHREGTLAHPTFRALARSVEYARERGLRVEVLGVLDNADRATTEIFTEALGPDGVVGSLVPTRILPTSQGDCGSSRNYGIEHTEAPWIGVLDADNLPSRNWIERAHATGTAHGSPCVIHPRHLVIFEGRWQLWPLIASTEAAFNRGNVYNHNYWDAFCMAAREVFEQVPYAALPGSSGFGPEDWHWGLETLDRGFPHLCAEDTELFYRVRSAGSLMSEHEATGSLLPQTALLTDTALAAEVLENARESKGPHRTSPRKGLQRSIVRHARGKVVPPAPSGSQPAARASFLRARSTLNVDHYRYLYADVAQFDDAQARRHYETHGESEGRRAALTEAELGLLQPGVFNVWHYRALNAEVTALDDSAAIRHYLETGHRAGLRALLSDDELTDVTHLDLEWYRNEYPDLAGHPNNALLQHFLEHGRIEGRQGWRISHREEYVDPTSVAPAVREEIAAMHRIEPWVQMPSTGHLSTMLKVGPPDDGALSPAAEVWWDAVDRIGAQRPDFLFIAPWVRMGGGDVVLARYVDAVRAALPDASVVVVTTHQKSTRTDLLGDARLIDLPAHPHWARLRPDEREALVATLVTQYRPRTTHVFNSPEFFNAFERYGQALGESTRLFLSTFVIDRGADGTLHNQLLRRPTDYLDRAEAVVVDSYAFVNELHEMYRFDPAKFVVHRHRIDPPQRTAWTDRTPGAPLRVLWAARFDRQKRLDILADIVEACDRAGLAVAWDVYGAPVTASASIQADIDRLERHGVAFHGTYAQFTDLPLTASDAFLFTSESEGIPLTLLDVMAHRLPVVAPMVGGLPELVTEQTGWPVERFDDIDAYVTALTKLAGSRDEAHRRAEAGYVLLEEQFSRAAFDAALDSLPGYLR